MNIQEFYSPRVVAVDSSFTSDASSSSIGRFFAQTAGTITITKRDGTPVLTAFPVTAGQQLAIHFRLDHGYTFTTAGGASGTLGIGN